MVYGIHGQIQFSDYDTDQIKLKIGFVPELVVKPRSRSETNLFDGLVAGGRSQAETRQQYRRFSPIVQWNVDFVKMSLNCLCAA